MDVMPLGAQLSLSGIEYYATLRPDTPLDRPKCGQCRSCCGCTNSTTGVSCMAVRFEIPKSLSINFVRRCSIAISGLGVWNSDPEESIIISLPCAVGAALTYYA